MKNFFKKEIKTVIDGFLAADQVAEDQFEKIYFDGIKIPADVIDGRSEAALEEELESLIWDSYHQRYYDGFGKYKRQLERITVDEFEEIEEGIFYFEVCLEFENIELIDSLCIPDPVVLYWELYDLALERELTWRPEMPSDEKLVEFGYYDGIDSVYNYRYSE